MEWPRLHAPIAEAWAQSLVRELDPIPQLGVQMLQLRTPRATRKSKDAVCHSQVLMQPNKDISKKKKVQNWQTMK